MTSKRKSPGYKLDMMGAAKAASVVFPFDPVPASRPRVSKWGTYYAKNYKSWLGQAAKILSAYSAVESFADASLLVVVESIVTKARTSKLTRPKGDVDNYAKGPLDAITKAARHWHDDGQVTALLSTKRFADPGEDARTEVHIFTLP